MTDETSLIIRKVTLDYVPAEDRILMRAQLDEGVVTFWLTQRVCWQLVPVMARHVEKTLSVPVAQERHRSMLQRHFQHESLVKKTPTRALDTSDPLLSQGVGMPASVLVKKMDVSSQGDRLLLSLPLAEDVVAAMSLLDVEVRQLLDIFFRVWCKAQWPRGVWPDWVDIPEAGLPAADSGALH